MDMTVANISQQLNQGSIASQNKGISLRAVGLLNMEQKNVC